jgi:RNA polymerase sigma-70 factor, ECF subfamily
MTDEHLVPDLVARAQSGDRQAAGALYDHYADRVFRFVRARLSNQQDAEDVTQRVFLQMIQALPRYERRGTPFGAWLFRIARNAVIDHQRVQRTHEPIDELAETASGQRGPEETAIARAEIDRVAAAMERLTDEQREVITLRFFADLSSHEVAAVLGRRDGAIRATQFRAVQALRRQLGGDDGMPAAILHGAAE